MKHIKLLPLTITLSFNFWLAFHENYTFCIWISWTILVLGFIGLCTEQYRNDIKGVSFLTWVLGFPFTVFNCWVFYNSTNGGYDYGILYVINFLIGLSILLHVNSKN